MSTGLIIYLSVLSTVVAICLILGACLYFGLRQPKNMSSGNQSKWHGKFIGELEQAVWKVIPGADIQTTDDRQIIIYTELKVKDCILGQFDSE